MSTYVTSSGNLTRGVTVPFSKFRLSLTLLCLFTLATTNPPNYAALVKNLLTESQFNHRLIKRTEKVNKRRRGREKEKNKAFSLNLFGYEFDLLYGKPTADSSHSSNNNGDGRHFMDFGTNFYIFSLDDRPLKLNLFRREIVFGALLNEIPICQYNIYDDESLCSWIADNLCHEIPTFSRKNRAFTAHRIIASTFIASVLLSCCRKSTAQRTFEVSSLVDSYQCSIRNVASWENLKHRPHAVIFSVFYRPSLIVDLLLLNIAAYPPLILMEKAVYQGTSTPTEADLQFAFAVVLLFLGIGGLSNVAASIASGRGCYGSMGAFAALLGYQTSVAPASILVHKTYIGTDITATDVLLFLTIIEISNFGKYTRVFLPNGWTSFLCQAFFLGRTEGTSSPVAWVVGGVLGIAFGHYHVERYALYWRLW
mmetsp:Transcript_14729/g.22846  ORF Transcript_14729/g.22846 Transcript_14729/m.22846 type:complete len:424 (+) Transcript_14729:116-1387(+)